MCGVWYAHGHIKEKHLPLKNHQFYCRFLGHLCEVWGLTPAQQSSLQTQLLLVPRLLISCNAQFIGQDARPYYRSRINHLSGRMELDLHGLESSIITLVRSTLITSHRGINTTRKGPSLFSQDPPLHHLLGRTSQSLFSWCLKPASCSCLVPLLVVFHPKVDLGPARLPCWAGFWGCVCIFKWLQITKQCGTFSVFTKFSSFHGGNISGLHYESEQVT